MDDIAKKEQYLLKYINVKYFRNNPEYINAWKIYYKEQKSDIKVLLCMKYNKISTYHHWIYIELSKFFERKKMPDISVYVLEEAICNNVYDIAPLQRELVRFSGIQKCNDKTAYKYLTPVNFQALGCTWNNQHIECYYNALIYANGMSFEEYRFLSRNYNEKHININEIQIYRPTDKEQTITSRPMNGNSTYTNVPHILDQNNDANTSEQTSCKKQNSIASSTFATNNDKASTTTINIKLFLTNSSDVIRIYYSLRIYNMISKHKLTLTDLSDFYLDKDFLITHRNDKSNHIHKETLSDASLHTIHALPPDTHIGCLPDMICNLLPKQLASLRCTDFVYNSMSMLQYFDIKRDMLVYQMHVYENIDQYL